MRSHLIFVEQQRLDQSDGPATSSHLVATLLTPLDANRMLTLHIHHPATDSLWKPVTRNVLHWLNSSTVQGLPFALHLPSLNVITGNY
jgi:phosphoribosylpyrophosphate synthetase